MPLKITKGGNESSFVYGSEYQRTRQDRSDGTTIVYAGTQEVESKGGQVTVKTYWPLGLGVEIDRAGATELNWLHKDRLGSPVAISDQGGVLKEKLAYDAWGKRRSSVDHSTLDTLDGQVDNKGYTNHEMLDQLDLVHMNGRVYDPLVGRFLSGDPFIQDPVNGQNYDRYSYVLNNPTNLIDPTGFNDVCPNGQKACPGMSLGGQNFGDTSTGATKIWRADEAAARAGSGTQLESNGNQRASSKKVEAQPKTDKDSANNTNWTGGQTKEVSASQVVDMLINGIKTDPTVETITTVVITGKKVSADLYTWAFGDIQSGAAAKADLRANWVQYGAGLMVLGNLRRGGEPLQKLQRYEGPKPTYHVNPAHVPGQRGFTPAKTPLPADAGNVFSKAVPNDPANPTAWFGKNSDGQIYRYSLGNDGTAHYSGTDGVGDGVRNLTKYSVDRLKEK